MSLRGPIQTKLAVGHAGDRYEQEADSVADRVISGRQSPEISHIPAGGLDGQRRADPEMAAPDARSDAAAESQAQAKCATCEGEAIQKKSDGGTGESGGAPAPVQRQAEAGSAPGPQRSEDERDDTDQLEPEDEDAAAPECDGPGGGAPPAQPPAGGGDQGPPPPETEPESESPEADDHREPGAPPAAVGATDGLGCGEEGGEGGEGGHAQAAAQPSCGEGPQDTGDDAAPAGEPGGAQPGAPAQSAPPAPDEHVPSCSAPVEANREPEASEESSPEQAPAAGGPPGATHAACEPAQRAAESTDEAQTRDDGRARGPGDSHRHQPDPRGLETDTAARLIHARGAGAPLPVPVRERIEESLGVDLDDVRVHTDGNARAASRALRAKAFTHRNHIFLGPGQSEHDVGLMAHESTHVLQQSAIVRRTPAEADGARVRATATPAKKARGGGASGGGGGPPALWVPLSARGRPAPCGGPPAHATGEHAQRQHEPATPAPAAAAVPAVETAHPLDEMARALDPSVRGYEHFREQSFVSARFLGVSLVVHQQLAAVLASVEARLPGRTLRANGIRGLGSDTRRAGGLHAWGLAIDVDSATNPYVMHEHGEAALDRVLADSYDRICGFVLGRPSIIVHQQFGSPPRAPGAARETAAARAGRLYDRIAEESRAMQSYFSLMRDPAALRGYLATAEGSARYAQVLAPAMSPGGTSSVHGSTPSVTTAAIDAIRRLMMRDWVNLSGSVGPAMSPYDPAATASAREPTASHDGEPAPLDYPAPERVRGDRPLSRSPAGGFLSLRRDFVTAMAGAGMAWGATDFGPESGDVMHFDLRNTLGTRITRLSLQQRRRSEAAGAHAPHAGPGTPARGGRPP